jgi:hypothetical protein
MMQYNDSQREQAMNHAKMKKQIINLQKKSFENCFSIMVTLQMQAENIFNFFHYLPIMSDEGKIFMKQRTDAYRKWIDDLRKAVNEGYAKIEALCDDDTMTAFRDQTEKIYQFYINQANWQPQNLNKTMKELESLYKRGCDEFKKVVDENIQCLKNYHNPAQKGQTKTKQND